MEVIVFDKDIEITLAAFYSNNIPSIKTNSRNSIQRTVYLLKRLCCLFLVGAITSELEVTPTRNFR